MLLYILWHTDPLLSSGPFLGNGSVNTFPLLGTRFLIMQQLDATIEELCYKGQS
jgi:hypothetical protein